MNFTTKLLTTLPHPLVKATVYRCKKRHIEGEVFSENVYLGIAMSLLEKREDKYDRFGSRIDPNSEECNQPLYEYL